MFCCGKKDSEIVYRDDPDLTTEIATLKTKLYVLQESIQATNERICKLEETQPSIPQSIPKKTSFKFPESITSFIRST